MIDMLPVLAEASGSLLLEAIDPTTTTTAMTESESLIARISIPESHRPMFINVLSNPPDLSLKIKKKAVRFNQVVLESNISVSSSKALRSPPLSGITSNTIIHSKAQSLSSVDNRDPEEKMAELMELKQMKIRQEDFLHLKDQILHVSQDLEDKENILDEVRSERKVLQSELSRYISMARQVQKDLELAQQAEAQLSNERDQLSQQLNQLKHHDFKILKEEVDQLRTKKGLHPLPSLEQEEAERMGRYLEQRRGQWRDDGISDDGGIGPSTSSSSSTNYRHGAAETYTSQSSHAASGSRTSTLSATFTMTTRARDHNTGTSYNHNLSGRNRHSGSVSNNNNNNNQGTIKSRYESSRRSSSSRTPGGSISSAASTRQSRSRSPGPKKRSRC
ncbi:hypothetical protein BGX34_000350 [Mortierella sp. NVP85]|nr:hypothetical protein BGX34_000350 [Mortierella sp. NVP85]